MLFQPKVEFRKENNRIYVNGEPMVFHCHHYNSQFAETVQLASYIPGDEITRETTELTVTRQFKNIIADSSVKTDKEKFQLATDVFKFFGFGTLEFDVNESGGVVNGPVLHHAKGWLAKFKPAKKPICDFARGFIAGVMNVIYEKNVNYYKVVETECMAVLGTGGCRFRIKVEPHPTILSIKEPYPNLSPKIVELPINKEASNIDEEAIINGVSQMTIAGNDEGLIPAFNVYLTNMYVDYYNLFSFEFEKAIVAEKGEILAREAEALLIDAAHICAVNTFNGIWTSNEWAALVQPMIDNPKVTKKLQKDIDTIYGFVAMENALGWGNVRVVEIIPGEKLVTRAASSYESEGYLKYYGKSHKGVCYMLNGVASGFMCLVYGDKKTHRFTTKETKCRAKGDEYCEFVTTPA